MATELELALLAMDVYEKNAPNVPNSSPLNDGHGLGNFVFSDGRGSLRREASRYRARCFFGARARRSRSIETTRVTGILPPH